MNLIYSHQIQRQSFVHSKREKKTLFSLVFILSEVKYTSMKRDYKLLLYVTNRHARANSL